MIRTMIVFSFAAGLMLGAVFLRLEPKTVVLCIISVALTQLTHWIVEEVLE